MPTRVLHSAVTRRTIVRSRREGWVIALCAVAGLWLGVQLAWPPAPTHLELLQHTAQFCIIIGLLEIIGFTLQEARSSTRLLFALLGVLVAALVLGEVRLAVTSLLPTQFYLLGSVALIWGLAAVLEMGSGDWWSWGRSMIGLLQLGMGVLLLVHPTFNVLDLLVGAGIVIMTASLLVILLITEFQPGLNIRPADPRARVLPAALAHRAQARRMDDAAHLADTNLPTRRNDG